MNVTVTIGNRLVPLEHIVAVEPFDPETRLPIATTRSFQGRVVLLDRESFLTEDPIDALALKHGFSLLREDRMYVNAVDVRFDVETFVPTQGFEPTKPFKSRLIWRDRNGEKQSKLLLSEPQTVLAIAVRGESDPSSEQALPRKLVKKPPRSRRKATSPGPI
jgi:hypothetical protein